MQMLQVNAQSTPSRTSGTGPKHVACGACLTEDGPLRHRLTLTGSPALPPGVAASSRPPSSRSTTAAPVRSESHPSSRKPLPAC